jgi:hypothetical protein
MNMSVNKLSIQFRKSTFSKYAFTRLRICQSCNKYSSFLDDDCYKCNTKNKMIDFETYFQTISVLNVQMSYLYLGLFCGVSMIFIETVMQLFISLGITCISFLLLWSNHTLQSKSSNLNSLHHFLIQNNALVYRHLLDDYKHIQMELEQKQYKTAYEKLRDLGQFINNEDIKNQKLICLNEFIIRKDMNLEISNTIIPLEFSELFTQYLLQVSRVANYLLNREVMNYVVTYRTEIEALDYGKELLTNTAAASLNISVNLSLYAGIILDHMEFMSKNKFLRLCRLLKSVNRYEHPELIVLFKKANTHFRNTYSYDPDFQGIF